METFQDYNINVPLNAPEQYRTTCPKCSHRRKKNYEKCLAVNTKKGIWLCHHCGWSGKLDNNIKKEWNNMNRSKNYNKPDWEDKQQNLHSKVVEYFNKRGISRDTLRQYDIQVRDKFIPARDQKVKSIAFPYKDPDGETISVKYRDLKKNFAKEKNTKSIFFGLNQIDQDDLCIITEGEIDVLSAKEVGFNAISVPNGAPSPKTKHYNMEYLQHSEDYINNIDMFVIATDNDKPGKKLGKELARRIGYEKCYTIDYPEDCKDLNDVLIQHGEDKLIEIISEAQEFPVQGLYNVSDIEQNVVKLWKEGIQDDAYSTGFETLNEYYKVRQYEFTVITGIPQHGKSEFLDSIVIRMIEQHGWKFGMFSPENYPLRRHLSKLVSKKKSCPFNELTEGNLKSGLKSLKNNVFFIYPEEEMTIDTILDKARTLIFRHGINALVLDPYNEFEHQRGSKSETEYISEFLSKLRGFVRKHNIHIFIVAHPRKMGNEKGKVRPPTAYDISGSANWFNKSDNIITVYRTQSNLTEIYIRKVRFDEIGKQGKIQIRYSMDKRGYLE